MASISCPDCGVLLGCPHEAGCDVAQCLRTGLQRLSCVAGHDCGEDMWSGEWPGRAEAERYGVDLNTLIGSGRFRWDRQRLQWVPKKLAHTTT